MNPSGQYAQGFQSGPVVESPYAATSTNTLPQLQGPTTPGGEMMSDMGQTGTSTQATTTAQPTGTTDARAAYDPTFKAATYSGPTESSLSQPSSFQQVAANAEANPKYIAGALAPGMVDEMTPKGYGAPAAQGGDADMGQRFEYQASAQYGSPSYKKIDNAEAKKLYGYAEGGDVQYPAGETVLRMASGGETEVQPGLEQLLPQHLRNSLRGSMLKPQGASDEQQYAGGGVIAVLIDKLASQGVFGNRSQSDTTAPSYTYDQQNQQYTQNMATGGGISTLGGYSDGGRLLKGPGDGMSDNIPAQIGAKQPARLADGEFVVPADVVSHLGNGSTDAGAKQLYKMMDKIRTARTGRKAQGKQVNPNKFLPR